MISARPYTVLLFDPAEVRGRIDYANDNPRKEGLPRQHWTFIVMYDNWPLHKVLRPSHEAEFRNTGGAAEPARHRRA